MIKQLYKSNYGKHQTMNEISKDAAVTTDELGQKFSGPF